MDTHKCTTFRTWPQVYQMLRYYYPHEDVQVLMDAASWEESYQWCRAKEIDEAQSEYTDWRM